jgi:hypothetical protein
MVQYDFNITLAFPSNCNFKLRNLQITLLMMCNDHILYIKLWKSLVLFGLIHRSFRHVMKLTEMENLALLLIIKTMKSTREGR